MTGVSGSGKSSLAFDILFNEGQRRYLESFSSYAGQYLKKLKRPAFESISGLSPAISISQSVVNNNPRSTVGTLSEIYDFLRLLFARLGKSENNNTNPSLSLFSFNSHVGACPKCKGIGVEDEIDLETLISDPELTIRQGALTLTTPNGYIIYSQVTMDVLDQVCHAEGFNVDIKWKDLTEYQKNIILYGTGKIKIPFGKHTLESRMKWSGITAKPREEGYYRGIVPIMSEILKRDRNPNILRFAKSVPCTECGGTRLNKDALKYEISGMNIARFNELSIESLNIIIQNLSLPDKQMAVANPVIKSILKRTGLLVELGLGYLTSHRESSSLSGGESQRIRLAKQICSELHGLLYVLDEPSVGLHQHDNEKLIKVLRMLVNHGNTVVVVEHDEETIRNADWIIDIGPDAGINGGEVIFCGEASDFFNKKHVPGSKTHEYYLTDKVREINRMIANGEPFHIDQADAHNLKNISATFISGALNVITGVSGAGKSSLVEELIKKTLNRKVNGGGLFDRLIHIDQSPIGRTPRSNPATYTKLFDYIRDIFGKLPESVSLGWDKSRFSFNNTGGRCEACEGAGVISIGMHFLGNVDVLCEKCNGKRFNDETLEIKYKGYNIFDILELSFSEAEKVFEDHPNALRIIKTINELGLSYLKLGQSAMTISGGEAQRVKLAAELAKSAKGKVIYILDEPTTGLHAYDIEILIDSLKKLIKKGHTVLVIEHSMEIISCADRIIDLGPGSGNNGGEIVAQCTPEKLIEVKASKTGKALQYYLKRKIRKIDFLSDQKSNAQIEFTGITTNNLKKIDVSIPVNKITVVTGLSGSGKSSLAFDTIYSEGQNRYLENFPSWVRRHISKSGQGSFETCNGLMPAIAISQQFRIKNPRSTVGTVSEIYDLYRLLYSRAGVSEKKFPASAFSFNNESGACEHCKGLGFIRTVDPDKFVSFPEKSIYEGAFGNHKAGKFYGDPYGQYIATLLTIEKKLGNDFSVSWKNLDQKSKEIIFEGTGETEYEVDWNYKRKDRTGTFKFKTKWPGLRQHISEEYKRKHADKRAGALEDIMSDTTCPFCKGMKLKPEVLDVSFAGKNISELGNMSFKSASVFLNMLTNKSLAQNQLDILNEILPSLNLKFESFSDLGIAYLSANRTISSLSGGELHRCRLATQLYSGLSNLIYILDEPTAGLHDKDTSNLLKLIRKLQKNNNTIIISEHDPIVISEADYIIDIGPGSGTNGGKIVAKGSFESILNHPESVTGKAILQNLKPQKGIRKQGQGIVIKGARANNLKNIDVSISSGILTVITGVSGSGKTSLLEEVINGSFEKRKAQHCVSIDGMENFDKVIAIISGATTFGNSGTVGTYSGLWDLVRDEMASLKEAKEKGLTKNHFSHNSALGKCPHCKGQGEIKMSMDFMADVFITCDECNGDRFNAEVLGFEHKGKNIREIMDLSISELSAFFSENRAIKSLAQLFRKAGLDYLCAGQSTNTLSGGEKQRLKLVSALAGNIKSNCLFLFDEPTTGLHINDTIKLLEFFNELLVQGHTIIVTEHNRQVIDYADYIIEMGPGAGEEGGSIVN
ncbi:MAG: hypothetical protein A2W91_07690 [Bacteroidetes bacterium GWF2_38_335]|nr:MAG: hypothetical protein A2W91_07690 [Bacteroidetes bacterium GWF2_38_335]OFY79172.1 MAG: hypothetical protein A2281_03030 [Bacteroidetes bacterium RIFOXYA12_FULL_38_20]